MEQTVTGEIASLVYRAATQGDLTVSESGYTDGEAILRLGNVILFGTLLTTDPPEMLVLATEAEAIRVFVERHDDMQNMADEAAQEWTDNR